MRYDNFEEKERLTTTEFLLLMLLFTAICIIGYVIGRIIITAIGG